MSTIDKQVRLTQLDRELYSQKTDIAYKAFNGTKQSVRNFREGTLDIGKMNFDNTDQDRITKEMVTDFHKKEQERYRKYHTKWYFRYRKYHSRRQWC